MSNDGKSYDYDTIATIAKQIEALTIDYEAAARAESEARKSADRARNALNEAQKRMEAAIVAMRKSAPQGSDWHAAQNRPKEVVLP